SAPGATSAMRSSAARPSGSTHCSSRAWGAWWSTGILRAGLTSGSERPLPVSFLGSGAGRPARRRARDRGVAAGTLQLAADLAAHFGHARGNLANPAGDPVGRSGDAEGGDGIAVPPEDRRGDALHARNDLFVVDRIAA